MQNLAITSSATPPPTELQAPAMYRGGFTVFSGNTPGRLQVAHGICSFTDDGGNTLFSLRPDQVKLLNVTSTNVMIRTHGGSKWNYDHIVDLSPESTKAMLEAGAEGTLLAGALRTPAPTAAGVDQMLYEKLAAEKTDNRLGWIAALEANGFSPRNRNVKWGFKVAVPLVLLLLAILIVAGMIAQKTSQ